MRTRQVMVGFLLIIGLLLAEVTHKTYAFTAAQSASLNNQPVQAGGVTLSGASSSVYAMNLNRMTSVVPGTSSGLDASAWLEFIDAAGLPTTLPQGWAWACGGHAYQYKGVSRSLWRDANRKFSGNHYVLRIMGDNGITGL